MGANAQTSVPAFTAGQILTAQQQTEINTGIPVFATTTTRDAAFGGTGEKTLAEGQFAYIEASNTTQYYDGAAWQTVGGGLTLIKTQTIGSAVSSVTVTNAFSATYDNYRIQINGGAGSAIGDIRFTLGATATGYYFAGRYNDYAGSAGQTTGANLAYGRMGVMSTLGISACADFFNPFLTDETGWNGWWFDYLTNGSQNAASGFLNNTTSYTDITFTPSSGTLTGGTIRVYGYQNS